MEPEQHGRCCAGRPTGERLMAKEPNGFVSLSSLKKGPPDPKAALAEIRRIYFRTTRETIEHDIAHAIELLMTLPSEEEREKASVFTEGLSQMQRDWTSQQKRKAKKRKPPD